MPPSDIMDKVSKVSVIMENSECQELVKESLRYHEEIYTQPLYSGRILNTRGVTDGILVFPYWNVDPHTTRSSGPSYRDIFGDLDHNMAYWKYLSLEYKQEDKFLNSHIPQNRICTDYVTSKTPDTFYIFNSDNLVKVGNFLYAFKTEYLDYSGSEMVTFRYNPLLDDWVRLGSATLNPQVASFRAGQCSDKHILIIADRSDIDAYTFYYIYSIADNSWKRGKAEIHFAECIYTVYHNGSLYITCGDKLLTYDMGNDAWLHLCKIQLTTDNWIGDCQVVGHDKSLFVLPSMHDPSYFEYNVETKATALFSNPILDTGCIDVSAAFSLGKCLYVMLHHYKDSSRNSGQIKDQRCRLYYFDPSTRSYTLIRALPCFCDQLYAAPMTVPRY